MIKPYTITEIREEENGNKTVFFTIRKAGINEFGNNIIKTLKSATYVSMDEDIDQVLFKDLQEAGWI